MHPRLPPLYAPIIAHRVVVTTFPSTHQARLPPYSAPPLPLRLRAFDASQLVPGLPALLAYVTRVRVFSAAVLEGVSVFFFSYAALQWIVGR